MSMSPRQRKENAMKPGPYGRLVEHVYAFADQYTGGRDIYYTGSCDSCGLAKVSLDKYRPSYGKHPEDWVRDHNQEHHEAQTRPKIKTYQPRLELSLRCGHVVEGFFKDGSDMVCSGELHEYKGKWNFEQPIYVCSSGHYNAMDQDLDSDTVLEQLDQMIESVAQDMEEWELERKLRELQARRRG